MRMRLRAPDEPEAETSYDSGAASPSTPDNSHVLPPLDVRSPEYIEERLENLKRRPNWTDFLDQYVKDHPDSDSEDEDMEEATVDAPGVIRSTLWSLLVVALAPLLILCAPCLRHKDYGFWPLGCRSMKELFGCAVANVTFMVVETQGLRELFGCAVANVTFMVVGVVLLYWTICRELPDLFNVNNTLIKLNVQMDEMHQALETCHAALEQWERTVAQELCMPVGIDIALLLLNAWLLLHFHRRWARYLMIVMVMMFVVDMPTKMYDATFPAPEIHKVDPTFALVDEELLVAVDGKNLKPGGSVAWVAYWGCATTANVDSCEKQFVSPFEAGNVAVTFKSLDHFIPCYRDPPNPLKAQDFQCFQDVRIRVKDMQSIPGWSKSALLASSDEQQRSLEYPGVKREERMEHDTIKSTYRVARSMESIEIDVSASMGLPTDSLATESKEEPELEKGAVEVLQEGAQENDSRISLEAESDVNPENIADEKLEFEVMSDAEVKLVHANNDLETTSPSEDVLPPSESLESATATEDTQDTSDAHIEVETDKFQAIPADKVIEELAKDLESDALVKEFITIIDEEIKGSAVTVVDEEEVQMEPGNLVDVKNEETSAYDQQSEETKTSAAISQQDEKKTDSKRKSDAPAHAADRVKESTKDGYKPKSISKTRKISKRKDKRSRQTEKASEATIADAPAAAI
ncbi:hypothetical protein PHMEG_0001602 [Phytophthora megakarya]|uniref:Transmembrane protein n=1 Tax=Phytophthora megakarya TaxID=4795 RepID=A0A225X193_9STRA|nr:hypothetical protein PHMEG_0001602 [Phytophthora megakarya]